jgi:hypothetical protein
MHCHATVCDSFHIRNNATIMLLNCNMMQCIIAVRSITYALPTSIERLQHYSKQMLQYILITLLSYCDQDTRLFLSTISCFNFAPGSSFGSNFNTASIGTYNLFVRNKDIIGRRIESYRIWSEMCR